MIMDNFNPKTGLSLRQRLGNLFQQGIILALPITGEMPRSWRRRGLLLRHLYVETEANTVRSVSPWTLHDTPHLDTFASVDV